MTKKRNLKFIENKKTINSLILVSSIILAITLIFLFSESGFIQNPFEELMRPVQTYSLEDKCSLIAGQIIHSIENEDACRINCMAECEFRDLNFHKSEFFLGERECNSCFCYCK